MFLKLYEPNTDARHVAASCSQYWGRLFKGFAGLPTVAEGNWQSYTENALGGFRLETHSFPAVFPGPSLNSRQVCVLKPSCDVRVGQWLDCKRNM